MNLNLFLKVFVLFNSLSAVISFSVSPRKHAPWRVSTSLAGAVTDDAAAISQNRPALKYPLTQVVSDIDDTLKSSGGVQIGGVALGGIDVQYARGEFYPGVFQFMWELSLFSVKLNQRYLGNENAERNSQLSKLTPPKVAVLTAVSALRHVLNMQKFVVINQKVIESCCMLARRRIQGSTGDQRRFQTGDCISQHRRICRYTHS